MSTPSAKRRRLDEAQSALRRPFRSPLKTPRRKEGVNPSADTTDSRTAVASPLVQSVLPDSSPDPNPTPPDSSSDSALRTLRSTCSSTTLPTPSASSPFARRNVAPDDPLAVAIRAEELRQRQLSRQINTLRSELDTLKQALTIATSTKDAELEKLMQKWREASRSAAEEVFDTVRDRVNKMGGIGAWRQREHGQREWGQGYLEEEEEQSALGKSEDDEDDEDEKLTTAEEREARIVAKEQRAEARAEAEKERKRRKDEWEREKEAMEAQQPKDADDESFTMDMMLRTLNIDAEMIGWDKGEQRWVG